jgi:hypothetical protein
MRWKCAIGLWIWALCLLFWAAKNLEPTYDWSGRLLDFWELAKVALLVGAGFLLIMADGEIEELKISNQRLDERLWEALGKLHGNAEGDGGS